MSGPSAIGDRSPILPQSPSLSLLVLRVYLPFALAYFFSYLYRTVNAVLSPVLTTTLDLSASDLGLLSAAYYVSFATFQLPLGVLLDKFGPRRVHASLLTLAALGAVLFAVGQSLTSLFFARALVGMGVAGGLMAAIKAISLWFPPQRWPMINGFHLAFGGMGAIAATKPVDWALTFTDWRGVFFGLGGLTLLVALSIFLVVPERPGTQASGTLRQAVAGVGQVFKSAWFWRVAPAAVLSQASFMAIQTLWSGPWFHDVAGFDRSLSADYLLAVAAAMALGFLLSGVIANALARWGVKLFTTLCCGYALFMVVQLLIVLHWMPSMLVIWMLFGFSGVIGVLVFPVLTREFPLELGGRVTTSANMLMFAAAFAVQSGIGAILDLWNRNAAGTFPHQAYTVAFAVPLALQAVTFIWLVWPRRRSRAPAN